MARSFLTSVLLSPLASAGMMLAVSQPAAAATECYADWSDAAPVVTREGLRTARDVQGQARDQLGAEVVRITLCQSQGGFIYRLVLRSADGRLRNTTVSAGTATH